MSKYITEENLIAVRWFNLLEGWGGVSRDHDTKSEDMKLFTITVIHT